MGDALRLLTRENFMMGDGFALQVILVRVRRILVSYHVSFGREFFK